MSGDGKTTIYLVRHGHTDWNGIRRIQGHLPVPPNALGEEQARALGRWLKSQPVEFTALYSSDLRRAAQTAWAIADELGLDPVYREELREIHCGEWQGLTVEEAEASDPAYVARWRADLINVPFPGGECVLDVQRRVFPLYTALVEQHRGEAIVIVSHGVALGALLAATQGWDLAQTWAAGRARMGNTGVTVLEVDHAQGAHRLVLLNATPHLPSSTGIGSVMDAPAEISTP